MTNNYYSKTGEHPLIGKRIRLSFTNDLYTSLKDGDTGTITDINEFNGFTQVDVSWDNGSKLMLIKEKDAFDILE